MELIYKPDTISCIQVLSGHQIEQVEEIIDCKIKVMKKEGRMFRGGWKRRNILRK